MASFLKSEPVSLSSSSGDGGGERMKKRRRLVRLRDLRDWSGGLARDVLFCVLEKLRDAQDHVRFGAVCLHWRSVFLQQIEVTKRPSCCSSGPPFLLIPPPPEEAEEEGFGQQMELYRLSTGRVSDFRLQVPHHKACRGSCFGWLVTVGTQAIHDCCIQLLNPFLNRTIDLPRIEPLNSVGEREYPHKAVLSSDPLSSPDDYVLVSIISSYYGLAFFRAGDTSWTTIRDDWKDFQDVIFSRKTNRFYALHYSGEVLAIDLVGGDACNHKLTESTPPLFGGYQKAYLVEDLPSGDLFQVIERFTPKCSKRVVTRLNNGKLKKAFHHTIEGYFTVFKLSATDGNWIKIDNIGQNIIFLGNSCSMLRSASDCPGCEPNCIYYTDDADFNDRLNSNYSGPHLNGVYDIKKGMLRNPAKIIPRGPCLPQPIWLEPTLRCCR